MAPNQEMDGHVGSAPTIPVWKTGVYLSALMPEEMESRAGIAPAFAALQAAAWANRPTGREIKVRAEAFASARRAITHHVSARNAR